MIPIHVINLIKKYSFVERYEQSGTNLIFHLEPSCPVKTFTVNKYRTSKNTLLKKIENIKKKIGYDNETRDWKRQHKNKR